MKKIMIGAMLLCSVALYASMRCKECGSGYTPNVEIIIAKEDVIQVKINRFLRGTDGRIHDIRFMKAPYENKIMATITYCTWK